MSFCRKEGIGMQKKIACIPQQNDLVEHEHNHFVRVRCMLQRTDLPKSFWEEFKNSIIYLINKSCNTFFNVV